MSHITIGLVVTNQMILYAIRPQGCCVPVTRVQHGPQRSGDPLMQAWRPLAGHIAQKPGTALPAR